MVIVAPQKKECLHIGYTCFTGLSSFEVTVAWSDFFFFVFCMRGGMFHGGGGGFSKKNKFHTLFYLFYYKGEHCSGHCLLCERVNLLKCVCLTLNGET